MFKLKLKGFKPLKDLEITSQDNIFIVTGDEGIGKEYLMYLLNAVFFMVAGSRSSGLYTLFAKYNINLPPTLEVSLTLDDHSYVYTLKKKKGDYIITSEEGFKGSKSIYKREGLTLGKDTLVDEQKLAWDSKTKYSNKLKFLQGFIPNKGLLSVGFTKGWYPLISDIRQTRASLKTRFNLSEELKGYVFDAARSILSGVEKVILEEKDGYQNLGIVNKGGIVWYSLSNQTLQTLTLLSDLYEGIITLYHPDSIIPWKAHDPFMGLIKEHSKEKPIFIFVNDDRWTEGYTTINIKTDKNNIVCTRLS